MRWVNDVNNLINRQLKKAKGKTTSREEPSYAKTHKQFESHKLSAKIMKGDELTRYRSDNASMTIGRLALWA